MFEKFSVLSFGDKLSLQDYFVISILIKQLTILKKTASICNVFYFTTLYKKLNRLEDRSQDRFHALLFRSLHSKRMEEAMV